MSETDKLWWSDLLERSRKSKMRRLVASRCWKIIKPAVIAMAIGFTIYTTMFCWRFELLGLPVITRDRGWIGPSIRHDKQSPDVGGVRYYDSSDYRLYDFYRPLCHAWIWMNGLPYGEFRT